MGVLFLANENTLNTPTMSVSLPDINNLNEGETLFVNSVQEVIDHVKQQCKAVHVKASLAKAPISVQLGQCCT